MGKWILVALLMMGLLVTALVPTIAKRTARSEFVARQEMRQNAIERAFLGK